jgi:glycine cleavage system aminomethyltransferase T
MDFISYDVKAEMENVSDDYSLLAIQGPKAVEAARCPPLI